MIPFDFEYHRPPGLPEAVRLFERLRAEGKEPIYYGGGTEFITLARLNLVRTRAVIDIKGIGELHTLRMEDGGLTVGAAVTLNAITDSGHFPLLGLTAGQIGDRTSRNKITLAGNICSRFIYREAVLPLLLADAAVTVAGPGGLRTASIHQIFHQRVRLAPGEMLLQFRIDPCLARLPFFHSKKRRKGHVGYPVVTLAALRQDGQIRLALSGVCGFPFRSQPMEAVLNERAVPPEVRAERAMQLLPGPVRDDEAAAADYRAFLLKSGLVDAIQRLEGVTA